MLTFITSHASVLLLPCTHYQANLLPISYYHLLPCTHYQANLLPISYYHLFINKTNTATLNKNIVMDIAWKPLVDLVFSFLNEVIFVLFTSVQCS